MDTRRFAAVYLSNNNTRNDLLFRDTDLRTVHPEHAVVFTASNRGRTYRLFDNPYHRRALAEMGLRPETAFGCAFRFLFKPNAAVMVRCVLIWLGWLGWLAGLISLFLHLHLLKTRHRVNATHSKRRPCSSRKSR